MFAEGLLTVEPRDILILPSALNLTGTNLSTVLELLATIPKMATEANDVATHPLSQLGIMDCPIAKLADEDVTTIFKNLPPYERLIVSGVCTKWRYLSQAPWRDVTHLNLNDVPTANIHAVIKKCPNLSSVSALRQNLGDLGQFASRLSNVSSLKCVECTFTAERNLLPSAVAKLRSASWNELIWHKSKTVTMDSGREYPLPFENPHTLRRLQMSDLSVRIYGVYHHNSASLQLPLLECLIMADINWQRQHSTEQAGAFLELFGGEWSFEDLATATNLRELYLDAPQIAAFMKLAFALPHLQIVFLNNIAFEQQSLERLMTQHRSLRVLVITASRNSQVNGEITIPIRKLFPNGFHAEPVPPLQLFLGKIAAGKFRFHPSPANALKIYPIDAPLPEFLEKEEIKPIFEGSWIASRIKKGAREGLNLANYAFEGNAESISYAQE